MDVVESTDDRAVSTSGNFFTIILGENEAGAGKSLFPGPKRITLMQI